MTELEALIEPFDQSRSGNQVRPQWRNVQFCAQNSLGHAHIIVENEGFGLQSEGLRDQENNVAGSPVHIQQPSLNTDFCLLSPVMLHRYDDISLFMPFFDIRVRLHYLFQRIASIYNRLQLPCLNKLFKND